MILPDLATHLCPFDKNPCVGLRCVKFHQLGPLYWRNMKSAVLAQAKQMHDAKNPIRRFFSPVDHEYWWTNESAIDAVLSDPERHGVTKTYECRLSA